MCTTSWVCWFIFKCNTNTHFVPHFVGFSPDPNHQVNYPLVYFGITGARILISKMFFFIRFIREIDEVFPDYLGMQINHKQTFGAIKRTRMLLTVWAWGCQGQVKGSDCQCLLMAFAEASDSGVIAVMMMSYCFPWAPEVHTYLWYAATLKPARNIRLTPGLSGCFPSKQPFSTTMSVKTHNKTSVSCTVRWHYNITVCHVYYLKNN